MGWLGELPEGQDGNCRNGMGYIFFQKKAFGVLTNNRQQRLATRQRGADVVHYSPGGQNLKCTQAQQVGCESISMPVRRKQETTQTTKAARGSRYYLDTLPGGKQEEESVQ